MSDLKTTKEIRRQMIDKGMVTASFDVVESVLTILDAHAAHIEAFGASLAGILKRAKSAPVCGDPRCRACAEPLSCPRGHDGTEPHSKSGPVVNVLPEDIMQQPHGMIFDPTPRPDPTPGLDEQVADARERHDERESRRIGPVREYTAETDSEGLVTKLTRVRDGLPDAPKPTPHTQAWQDYSNDLRRLLGERDAEIATRQEREERLCRDKGRILGYERKAQEQVRVRDANLKRICTDRYNLGEALTTERESHVVTEEQREAALGDYNTEHAKVVERDETIDHLNRLLLDHTCMDHACDRPDSGCYVCDRDTAQKRADDAEAKLEADTRKWLIQGADLSMARAAETTRAEKLKVELAEAEEQLNRLADTVSVSHGAAKMIVGTAIDLINNEVQACEDATKAEDERDTEIAAHEKTKALLREYTDDATAAMSPHPDEKHCPCAKVLRSRVVVLGRVITKAHDFLFTENGRLVHEKAAAAAATLTSALATTPDKEQP